MSVKLPDVVRTGLPVVFCGTAAGAKSAAVRAYYAGPGNQFWPVLARTGLTLRQIRPADFRSALDSGIGLTDVCKLDAGSDRAIGNKGFDVPRLLELLEQNRPKRVAFNGKKAAEIVLGRKVDYGPQPERIAGARVHVLPSTSGAARGAWNEAYWRELAREVRAGPR